MHNFIADKEQLTKEFKRFEIIIDTTRETVASIGKEAVCKIADKVLLEKYIVIDRLNFYTFIKQLAVTLKLLQSNAILNATEFEHIFNIIIHD